jgi:monooxygenase
VVVRGRALDGDRARTDTGETVRLTCSWLSVCSGYYRYDEGFRPRLRGRGALRRHARAPAALARGPRRTGKRIVVIGSGATAVTLVPSLAERPST